MKGMVLAAGLGTRLRPLTDDRPKALVEIAGRTLLDLAVTRLEDAGCREIVVNTHHFADQVAAWVERERPRRRARLRLSPEPDQPLDTGGGLWQARAWLRGADPVLVHNVDVLSEFPLDRLIGEHRARGALATLAVQDRPTRRRLLFDAAGRLAGRAPADDPPGPANPPATSAVALAFGGVQAVAPAWFDLVEERGAFSVIDAHLRLAAAGHPILAWRADPYRWLDVGRPEHLARAQREWKIV